tara:strand:+ start:420 stop:683 length:264 start_codon:yes stop_codon:yes gene_type:complete
MLDPGQKKKGGYKRGASKASGKAGYIRGRGLELKQIRREGTKPVEKYPIQRKVKIKRAAQFNSGYIYRHVWPTPKGGPNIKGGRRSK